jgi:hypothetical protein
MIKVVATMSASALLFVLADDYFYYGQHAEIIWAMMCSIAHSFGS